jgi:hypothetical protein
VLVVGPNFKFYCYRHWPWLIIGTSADLHIGFMNDQKDKLPLFKSWIHWYVLVIGFLIVLILLFYWLTKTFA